MVFVAGLFYTHLKNEKKRQNEISKMRNFSKIRTTGFQSGDIFLQDAFSFGTEFSNSYPVFQLFFQGCRINCSTPGYNQFDLLKNGFQLNIAKLDIIFDQTGFAAP